MSAIGYSLVPEPFTLGVHGHRQAVQKTDEFITEKIPHIEHDITVEDTHNLKAHNNEPSQDIDIMEKLESDRPSFQLEREQEVAASPAQYDYYLDATAQPEDSRFNSPYVHENEFVPNIEVSEPSDETFPFQSGRQASEWFSVYQPFENIRGRGSTIVDMPTAWCTPIGTPFRDLRGELESDSVRLQDTSAIPSEDGSRREGSSTSMSMPSDTVWPPTIHASPLAASSEEPSEGIDLMVMLEIERSLFQLEREQEVAASPAQNGIHYDASLQFGIFLAVFTLCA